MKSRAQIQSHPIHPMLVVMPLGLLIGGWIFDLIGKMTNNDLLWAASYYCAIAGIIAGLCAAIPGLIDWFSVVPPEVEREESRPAARWIECPCLARFHHYCRSSFERD